MQTKLIFSDKKTFPEVFPGYLGNGVYEEFI
jgi:hypothetical protein